MAQRLPGNKRERVKDLRMERGLSLSELASRVGCNETTLGRYERGETDRIGDEIVRLLAREFWEKRISPMSKISIFRSWGCPQNLPSGY